MSGNGRTRMLHIGLSIAVTWLTGDAWRRADSGVEEIFSSAFYVDLAKRAEAAKLDFLFRPDTLFLDPEAARRSPGFSSLDPSVLLAAIAGETDFIGLVSTASTTFYPPYVVARQLQSLNWLSKGRAGWNIVTSLDGAANFGLDRMPSSEERYRRAAEFTEVVRALWCSYPGDAVTIDRASGLYADPARVAPIDHDGAAFRVRGPLNVPAFGSDAIPLFQAGASPAGRDFAASVADAIFAAAPDRDAGAELRSDLRRRMAGHGRDPDALLVLPGLSLYLAPTRREAEELFAETHARQDAARIFKAIEAMIGLDLSDAPLDHRLTGASLPEPDPAVRSRTHADLLRRYIAREEPTVGELLKRPEVVGSAHWRVVGTVDDALRDIAAWADAGAADGFIALPGGSRQSLDLLLEELVPRLAESGRFRRDYGGATLAAHLRER